MSPAVYCQQSFHTMCSRGVFQLQKLSMFFCDYGGSSSGVRELITSQKFKDFFAQNPHIKLDLICKRNHHPHIKGVYINGYEKAMPLRSYTEQQILQVLNTLRNQLGRQPFKVNGSRVFGAKKSIQGKWQPNMFNKYPLSELSVTHEIPDVEIERVEREDPYRNVRREDITNRTMKVRPIIDIHRDRA